MKEDIKDIKLPVDIPDSWIWLWISLGTVLLVALIVWIALRYSKKSKAEKKIESLTIGMSSWDKAYGRLENLRLNKLIENLYLKPFYIELSDIARHYLEERFSIKAPEMTTEEFLDSLRVSPTLNDEQKQILKEFLYTCDMVKFAKFQPTVSEAQKSFDLVKLLIDQTHGN